MITAVKKRSLKALAHKLKPVVMIGTKGLTDTVMQEVDISLETHELIKIRIAIGDKDAREEMAEQICTQLNAHFIHSIGHIVIIYRKRKEQKKKTKK